MIYIVMMKPDEDAQPRAMAAFRSRNAARDFLASERKAMSEQYPFLNDEEIEDSLYMIECQLEG